MLNNENNGNADNISNAQQPENIEFQLTKKRNSKMKESTPKRKITVDPVFAVLKKAHNQFGHQVTKDNDIKRACIESNIGKHYDDSRRFWVDFGKRTEVLLDSKRFNKYCEDNKLNPEEIAEHVVFEGKAFCNRVAQGEYRLIHEIPFAYAERLSVSIIKSSAKSAKQQVVATSA